MNDPLDIETRPLVRRNDPPRRIPTFPERQFRAANSTKGNPIVRRGSHRIIAEAPGSESFSLCNQYAI
ncbi:hypothetical protein LINPERHAP2_LOCUS23499 [Linum perenne]